MANGLDIGTKGPLVQFHRPGQGDPPRHRGRRDLRWLRTILPYRRLVCSELSSVPVNFSIIVLIAVAGAARPLLMSGGATRPRLLSAGIG